MKSDWREILFSFLILTVIALAFLTFIDIASAQPYQLRGKVISQEHIEAYTSVAYMNNKPVITTHPEKWQLTVFVNDGVGVYDVSEYFFYKTGPGEIIKMICRTGGVTHLTVCGVSE